MILCYQHQYFNIEPPLLPPPSPKKKKNLWIQELPSLLHEFMNYVFLLCENLKWFFLLWVQYEWFVFIAWTWELWFFSDVKTWKKKQRLGLNTLRYCFLSWTINNKTIKRDSCIIATNMKCFGHYFLGPWKPVC